MERQDIQELLLLSSVVVVEKNVCACVYVEEEENSKSVVIPLSDRFDDDLLGGMNTRVRDLASQWTTVDRTRSTSTHVRNPQRPRQCVKLGVCRSCVARANCAVIVFSDFERFSM